MGLRHLWNETTKHPQSVFELLKHFVKFGGLSIGQLDASHKAPSRVAGSLGIPLIALELLLIACMGRDQGKSQPELYLGSHEGNPGIEICEPSHLLVSSWPHLARSPNRGSPIA